MPLIDDKHSCCNVNAFHCFRCYSSSSHKVGFVTYGSQERYFCDPSDDESDHDDEEDWGGEHITFSLLLMVGVSVLRKEVRPN